MTATRLLITADRVWDGVSARPVERGFVLVDGPTIVAVGRQADLGSAAEVGRRVDLPGATVLPGLVNAHVHLTFSASADTVGDYRREAAEGPATLTVRAIHNLEAAARAGVTTVRDLGTLNEVAFAAREAAASGAVAAPRVLTSGRPITTTGGHCHWFSHECDSPTDVRAAVRRQVRDGADVIKIFAGGGNMTPRSNPFAAQFTDAELAAAVAEAERLGVPVTAHAHAPEVIRLAVAAGVNSVEHATFEARDGVEYDPATGDAMARAGIAFCPTLGDSFLRAAADPAMLTSAVGRRFVGRLPDMRKAMRQLLDAGAPLLAGSDAGVTHRPFSDYPADVAALAGEDGLGLTPRQALVAATSGAASILGLDDTGVLAPGRRADLLAVVGDPLTDLADLGRTRYVLVAGREVPLSTYGG